MDDDRMETGTITSLGNGWYYSSEINQKFRFGERGEIVSETGTVLAPAPSSQGAEYGDSQGDGSDAEEDTLP